ncbi:MAG TPA: radical SAM protein [Candidatus Omnitrophota bacterium]|nr:radical SAM protein [Candidatus Omnitrophota bacterium]
MTIDLQNSVLYGPVRSRRLGNSLGVNILPLSRKCCDFHCVYCQYGATPDREGEEKIKRAGELFPLLERELRAAADSGVSVDCITIAGNGEPTLHPDFPEAVDFLRAVRDRYYPKVRLGILTNGSRAYLPSVREALIKLDDRYVKLDAGTEEEFKRINRPQAGIGWQDLIEGVRALPDKTVQSLFVGGVFDNAGDAQVNDWIRIIQFVRPQAVHVYSIDRGPAEAGVLKLPEERLEAIAKKLKQRTGISARVFA